MCIQDEVEQAQEKHKQNKLTCNDCVNRVQQELAWEKVRGVELEGEVAAVRGERDALINQRAPTEYTDAEGRGDWGRLEEHISRAVESFSHGAAGSASIDAGVELITGKTQQSKSYEHPEEAMMATPPPPPHAKVGGGAVNGGVLAADHLGRSPHRSPRGTPNSISLSEALPGRAGPGRASEAYRRAMEIRASIPAVSNKDGKSTASLRGDAGIGTI